MKDLCIYDNSIQLNVILDLLGVCDLKKKEFAIFSAQLKKK